MLNLNSYSVSSYTVKYRLVAATKHPHRWIANPQSVWGVQLILSHYCPLNRAKGIDFFVYGAKNLVKILSKSFFKRKIQRFVYKKHFCGGWLG